MKKKIMVFTFALMVVAMMILPVMGKGPANAIGKNPNLVAEGIITPLVEIQSPSGVINRWVGSSEGHTIVKPADKFHIPTQLNAGNNWLDWLSNPVYKGKWAHMNKGVYVPFGPGYLGLRATFGLSEPDVPEAGVYLWQEKPKD